MSLTHNCKKIAIFYFYVTIITNSQKLESFYTHLKQADKRYLLHKIINILCILGRYES